MIEMNGCAPNCTKSAHGIPEYDILRAHSMLLH